MGGGGGGGRGLTLDELKRLEDKARQTLRDEASAKTNVFISFAAEDLNDVNLLRAQAKNENSNIEFNDWSLKKPFDSSDSEYIKRGIRERIRQSSVTIVYVSDRTTDSRWVDWEIRESIAMGKGIVAMHKGDQPPKRLPPAVVESKIPVVPWNQRQLAEAIDRARRR